MIPALMALTHLMIRVHDLESAWPT